MSEEGFHEKTSAFAFLRKKNNFVPPPPPPPVLSVNSSTSSFNEGYEIPDKIGSAPLFRKKNDKKNISEYLHEISIPIESLLNKQKALLEDLSSQSDRALQLVSEINQKNMEISCFLQEQNKFCAEERFEEAENLEIKISNTRNILDSLIKEQNQIPFEKLHMKMELSEIAESIQSACENAARKLTESKQAILEEISTTQKDDIFKKERISAELKLINIENDRLSVLKEETLKSRDSVDERSRHVEEEISRSTVDLREKKESEQERLRDSDLKISELEEKLMLAKKEREEISSTIEEIDNMIRSEESAFASELALLKPLINSIENQERDIEMRTNLLQKEQTSLEEKLAKIDLESEHNQKAEGDIETKLAYFQSIESMAHKLHGFRKILHEEHSKALQSAAKDAEAVESTTEDVSVLHATIEDKENEIAHFKALVADIKDRLPRLENEKKAAVLARAFKEAKDITDEIKECNLKISSVDDELSLARTHLAELRDVYSSKLVQQDQARTSLSAAHKRIEESEMSSVEVYINSLHEMKCDESIINEELSILSKIYPSVFDKLAIRINKDSSSSDPLAVSSHSSFEAALSEDSVGS